MYQTFPNNFRYTLPSFKLQEVKPIGIKSFSIINFYKFLTQIHSLKKPLKFPPIKTPTKNPKISNKPTTFQRSKNHTTIINFKVKFITKKNSFNGKKKTTSNFKRIHQKFTHKSYLPHFIHFNSS